MKRIHLYSIFIMTALSFCGCQNERKIVAYSDIYSEKTTSIYIAPIEDHSKRRFEKYPKDAAYNKELNTAAAYMEQTLADPLITRGYYLPGPLATERIKMTESRSVKELKKGDLSQYYDIFGIDAVLFTTIHKWTEANGEWVIYAEYEIRSTKSNIELMHNWVKGTKRIPTDLKGDPLPMKQDLSFSAQMGFDVNTAQRCYLVSMMNDYVLRNLPISSLRDNTENVYEQAIPRYFHFIWTEEGSMEINRIPMEEYENGCFVD